MKDQSQTGKSDQPQRQRATARSAQRMRLKQKAIFVTASALSLLILAGLVLYFQFAKVEKSYAASTGDYRAVSTGNWNSTSTWQTYNGSGWVTAGSAPTSASGIITIQSGYTVTVTANVTVDQVVINSGGEVDLNSGDTLTIAHNTATDFDVTGTFKNAGTVVFNASATMVYENGGIYIHNFTTTAGTIPTATWNTGSTCEVTGYTSNATAPAGAQAFYNFTWNCPNQTGDINFLGALTQINGTFNLINTGTGSFRFSTANCNVNILGNYIQSGGTMSIVNSNNKDSLYIYGNFTQTGGTLTMSTQSNARSYIVFSKSGKQTFTASNNSVVGKVSYIVTSGSIVDMDTSVALGYDFTVNSGGALILASPYGITATSMQGNVQCTDNRSYSTGANYTYDGTTAQVTGDGLPSQVNNLTLNNSANCTLTASASVSDSLYLIAGIWIATSDTLTLGISTSTLGALSRTNGWVDGYFKRWIAAATTSNVLFPIGTLTYYNGANFSFTSAPTTAGSIVSTFIPTNPGTAGLPLTDAGDNCTNVGYAYWWFAAANSFAGGAYSVNLYANGFPGVSDYTHLHIFRRVNSSSSWTINGTHVAGTGSNAAPIANRTSMTALGNYGIVSPTVNVLPIELISFDATPDGNVVALSWSTASEINNDYFTISRSQDGINYEEILKQPGAGTSTLERNYVASDDAPLQGISYYRLTQTDYNGHFVNFPPQVVEYSVNESRQNLTIKTAGPNPFTSHFNINYSMPQAGIVDIQISSASGQMVYRETVNADKGFNTYSYTDIKALPHGVYIINLTGNGEMATQKLVKQ